MQSSKKNCGFSWPWGNPLTVEQQWQQVAANVAAQVAAQNALIRQQTAIMQQTDVDADDVDAKAEAEADAEADTG